MIKENLEIVEENIKAACEKSGRARDEVRLIAVSKTKPIELLKEAYDQGIRDFGENKVQEILDKYEQLPGDVRWHMIGHLQTNKVKYIIDKVCMIHSVDSLHLAQEISKQAVKKNVVANILVEINIGDEASKFGSSLQEASELVESIVNLPNISVHGLMTVAPYVVDMEENRPLFAKMSKLCVDIKSQLSNNNTGKHNVFTELSMGMTGDYQVAIEEGSTYVRVGTGIFGERNYNI